MIKDGGGREWDAKALNQRIPEADEVGEVRLAWPVGGCCVTVPART